MVPTRFFRKVKASSEHLLGESNDVRRGLQLPVLVRPPAARHRHPGLDFIANEGNVLLHNKFRMFTFIGKCSCKCIFRNVIQLFINVATCV